MSKRAVDRSHAALRGAPPLPFHQFAGPFHGKAGRFTRFPSTFELGGDWTIACKASPWFEQACRGGNRRWVVGQVEHDGVHGLDKLLNVVHRVFDEPGEMMVGRERWPTFLRSFEVFKANLGVLLTRFHGDVNALVAKHTSDVEGQTRTSDTGFEDGIARSQTEAGEEEPRVLASDGLCSSHHAPSELRNPWSEPLQFFLPDHHVLTNVDFAEDFCCIEDTKTFDLLRLIQNGNDVGFPVAFAKNCPCIGHAPARPGEVLRFSFLIKPRTSGAPRLAGESQKRVFHIPSKA